MNRLNGIILILGIFFLNLIIENAITIYEVQAALPYFWESPDWSLVGVNVWDIILLCLLECGLFYVSRLPGHNADLPSKSGKFITIKAGVPESIAREIRDVIARHRGNNDRIMKALRISGWEGYVQEE